MRRTGFRTARAGRDTTVRAVVVEGFFTRLGFGIVTFALPLYALQLGMSLAEVGLLAGIKALVAPVVKPLVGVLVDRFGARRGYLVAVSLRLAASLLLLLATTPALLFAVRILQGAASAARDPASISLLAKRSRLRLGRTFSITIGAKDLGNLSAGVVGGLLLAATGGDFRLLWLVVIALAVVPLLVVAAWVPPGSAVDDAEDQAADSEPPPVAPARLWRDRRLRAIALLGLFAGTTAHMTHGLFQVYAVQVGGLNAGQVGLIYSTAIATLLVLGPAAGYAADRFGTDRLAGVRGAANAVSSIIYLVAPSFAGLLAGRLVDEGGKAAFRPTWGALLATAARADSRRGGKIAAGLDTALSLGEALGPLLAGLLWQWWGVATFLLVRAGLGISIELLLGRRLRATDPAHTRAAGDVSPPE